MSGCWLCRLQRRKNQIGRVLDQPEQRACRAARRALALLPVAHRPWAQSEQGGKPVLGQPELFPQVRVSTSATFTSCAVPRALSPAA